MKKIFSEFSRYSQKKVSMNPSAKEKIKQDLRNYYASLYGNDSTATKVRWFVWGFFQPPLTFAKLAVYIIGTTTLSTWVYASIAPESFSQTSNAVSTTVQKAVSTTLEVLHIKPTSSSDESWSDQNNENKDDDKMTKWQNDDSDNNDSEKMKKWWNDDGDDNDNDKNGLDDNNDEIDDSNNDRIKKWQNDEIGDDKSNERDDD